MSPPPAHTEIAARVSIRREAVAREIRPEFVQLIENGGFVPTYAEIVSMTPQEVLDRSQQR